MAAEQLQIKLGISGTYWDRRPEYRVSFNGLPMAQDHIRASTGVTEYIEFPVDYHEETVTLTVALLNKRPRDTMENNDKTGIMADMLLNITELHIDDIDVTHLLHQVSEYRPEYPEHHVGDAVVTRCVNLGWNGVWSITWTNPFYHWLLDHL